MEFEDIEQVLKIIKERIKPEGIGYTGFFGLVGYFKKDGIRVGFKHDSMMGNWLEYKGERTEFALAKLRMWARIVFDELMRSEQGK